MYVLTTTTFLLLHFYAYKTQILVTGYATVMQFASGLTGKNTRVIVRLGAMQISSWQNSSLGTNLHRKV
jgi:hypothetical protein